MIAQRYRAFVFLCLVLVGCSATPTDDASGTRAVAQALVGSVNITGQARNAQGIALPGVLVTLIGPSSSIQTTDANGNYAFNNLPAGSYIATPAFIGCGFVPATAILGNVVTNTVQNFDGSGLTCGRFATGRLTVSGQITSANGFPLAGVSVQLVGSLLAPQTTNVQGIYTFTGVSPGSYLVLPVLFACSFTPDDGDLLNITDNTEQDFAAAGAGCANTGAGLGIDSVGSSVWADGSVSLAAGITNFGVGPAAQVQVTSISFDNATRVTPTTLPVALGEIDSGRSVVLKARFTSVSVPGTHRLSVSGTYVAGRKALSFSGQADVAVSIPTPVATPTRGAVVTKTAVPTTRFPPSPTGDVPDDNNEDGPPVPDGPFSAPFAVPPNNTSPQPASAQSPSVVFLRDGKTGKPVSQPPDPVGAEGGGVVFSTANTFGLFSADDGVTFTTVDPTTIFPQSDGGACCDQVVIYAPSVNLFFWEIQYRSPPTVPPGGQTPNRLRVAFATPEAMKANISNCWQYVDLQSSTYGIGNASLDFPDLAITNTFLYVSVDAGGGRIFSRMSLADLANPSVVNVNVTYAGPNESSALKVAKNSHFTQNSPDGVYWAAHVDTSHVRVFHWADSNSSSIDAPHDVQHNTYCNSDYASVAPDGHKWLDDEHPDGTGAIIAAARKLGVSGGHGELWFGWGAGRDSGSCNQGRPQPYVKIVRIDDTTYNTVGEYHIWNSGFAFAYAALATDPTGALGVSVAFGGPSNFATTTAGYLGDFVVYYNEPGEATPTFTTNDKMGKVIVDSMGNPVLHTRYGDFLDVRNSGPSNSLFSSEGYAVKLVDSTMSTSCSTGPGCTINLHYIQWGRPAEPPPQ